MLTNIAEDWMKLGKRGTKIGQNLNQGLNQLKIGSVGSKLVQLVQNQLVQNLNQLKTV